MRALITNMRRRWKVAAVIAVVALATSTGSFAYWSAQGSGSASAPTVDNPLPLTISPATPSTHLFPGGSSDVALTISNPNPFRVHVNSLELDTGAGSGGFEADNDCDVSALSYAVQSNGTAGWNVPKQTGTTDGTLALDLADAVSMDASAENDCQGATFKVYLQPGP